MCAGFGANEGIGFRLTVDPGLQLGITRFSLKYAGANGLYPMFFQFVSGLGYQVVGDEPAKILGGGIGGQNDVLPARLANEVEKLGVTLGNHGSVVPLVDQGHENPLQDLKIHEHAPLIRLTFQLHDHPVRVTVKIFAVPFMPRQAVGSFPMKLFGYLHDTSRLKLPL
jgi:hypothetical protein